MRSVKKTTPVFADGATVAALPLGPARSVNDAAVSDCLGDAMAGLDTAGLADLALAAERGLTIDWVDARQFNVQLRADLLARLAAAGITSDAHRSAALSQLLAVCAGRGGGA